MTAKPISDERLAELIALREKDGLRGTSHWDDLLLALRELQARRELALREGFVLVPVVPTKEMQKAMAYADSDYTDNNYHGHGSDSRQEFIYRAMISASQSGEGGTT